MARPQRRAGVVDEIKNVTDKPIKYLIYSHVHFDHIAGGKAFKDAARRHRQHNRTLPRGQGVKDPQHLGDAGRVHGRQEDDQARRHHTRVELSRAQPLRTSTSCDAAAEGKDRVHRRHDSVGVFPGRGFIDIYPLETEEFIKKVIAMDWDRMIPGHPGPGDRLGTKDDAKAVLDADAGGVRGDQDRRPGRQVLGRGREGLQDGEVRATLPGYQAGLGMVARRYCALWGRGA